MDPGHGFFKNAFMARSGRDHEREERWENYEYVKPSSLPRQAG
ncbi:hypothetical protein Thiosp_04699 [Thiorhodovibrio litoralis]|nr:hypothetical protein Thiosp_04699 [Thiorhodovibrio litoralis]